MRAATGFGVGRKLLRFNWALALLLFATASLGFLTLYSIPQDLDPWASRQMARFGAGFAGMVVVALIDIRFWRLMAPVAYLVSLGLLVAVQFIGHTGMGATRWLALGPLQLQPSEMIKVAIVMALATYYAWLPPEKTSRPLWLIPPILLAAAPAALVLVQPDLGTAVMLLATAAAVMFVAGAHWLYFAAGAGAAAGAVWAVLESRGTEWQLLKDYQFRRIDVFLDPSLDPLGAGYHLTQATIALGSGGLSGRGFMQGTQTALSFLPESHTDFIFTALAEQFGFLGGLALLILYALILMFLLLSTLDNRDRFGAILTAGLGAMLFVKVALNVATVLGLMPADGAPLPLVSYGGSSMLVMMFAFGLVQSAHIHRPT